MSTNEVYPSSRYLTRVMSHPVVPSSGQPCRYGNMTGVAIDDEGANIANKTTMDTEGVYDLLVKGVDDNGASAITGGDKLYYVDADIGDGTGFLSKKISGYFYGYALEAVDANATATINVGLVPSSELGVLDIADNSITNSKMADNSVDTPEIVDAALSADAAGRAKVEDGYFNEATVLAKFAADSIDNAELLQLIKDGAFNADAGTRALFDDGIWPVAKLAVPKYGSASKTMAFTDFTDDAGTSGHCDFDSAVLPAGAIPLGVKYDVTTGFAGDTTAVVQTGVNGDIDRFSSVTDQSVLADASKVGHGVATDACDGIAAAQTPRVTVTGAADFTSINAGSMTVTIYWLETE